MGLVVTLHLGEPGPFAEVGCCFSDGACQIMLAGECLGAGGRFTAVPPLGDLDGDGVDDACLYAAQPGGGDLRLTLFSPSLVLTEEALSALVEYERIVLELAGAPGIPDFQPERRRVPPGPMGPWPPPRPPRRPAGSGSGSVGPRGPIGPQSCIERYEACMSQARSDLADALSKADADLAHCLRCSEDEFYADLFACVVTGLVGGPKAYAACAAVALAQDVKRRVGCFRDYERKVGSARQQFERDKASCELQAAACDAYWLVPY